MKRACLLKKLFIIAMFVLTGIFRANASDAPPPKPAPVSLPKLSKAQMLEDFDYMTKVLYDLFPAATVNKKVYGIDIFEKLKFCRTKITGNETPAEFTEFMLYALLACKGSHLALDDLMFRLRDKPKARAIYKDFIPDDATIDISHAYMLSLFPKYMKYIKLLTGAVPLIYHHGDYYTQFDFTVKGITYKYGMKLLDADGKTSTEMLLELQDRLPSFDFDRKIFYASDGVDLFMERGGKMPQEYNFQDENGKKVHLSINGGEQITLLKPKHPCNLNRRMVEYFQNQQILYFRIPVMNEQDIPFYLEGIRKKNIGNKFRSVVLDVRGNGGGSDLVWMKILQAIIAQDYYFQRISAAKTKLAQMDAVIRFYEISKDSLKIRKIPFLDNEEFLVMEDEFRIKPEPDSLKLKIPIYVIAENIYSSTGDLTGLADKTDDITSVGTRNPAILGMEPPPLVIALPNSRLIFRISPFIDITGCKTAEDALHTKMEVEVEMTAKERLDYLNRDISKIPLEEALTKYDPYFKKVLELLNAKNQSGK